MLRLLSITALRLATLALFCIVLYGCALTSEDAPETKSALYVDAVLEFVVEYPQSWQKDRRLQYGRAEGEVRWVNPEQPDTMLIISSTLRAQQTSSIEQRVAALEQEFSGLQILTKEFVTLAKGQAWHIVGNRSQSRLDIYLPLDTRRNYRVTLVTPAEQAGDDSRIMQKVIDSFSPLDPAGA